MTYNINDIVVEYDENSLLAFYVITSIIGKRHPYKTKLIRRINENKFSVMISFGEGAEKVRLATKLELLLYEI